MSDITVYNILHVHYSDGNQSDCCITL